MYTIRFDLNVPFTNILTRPSAAPPEGAALSVLEIGHIVQPKGKYYPKSISYYCCLIWCVTGAVLVRGDGWSRRCTAGQMTTIKHGETFDVYMEVDQTEAHYIQLDGEESIGVLATGGLWPGVFPCSEIPHELLTMVRQHFEDEKKQDWIAAIAYSIIPLAYADARANCDDPLIFEMCSHIHTNWSNTSLNVDTLTDKFSIGKTTASQKFKKFTGISILDYIADIRLRESHKMLRDNVLPIQEIANQCGFSDAAYFSSWFRKRHGISPSSLRQLGS